ncbi:MAG: type IX secretion system protein PorQ [Ignavibacteriales bacterium]|nr:type IX secretion system protein PorQ [Ignavibacteriales bacterium]
MRTNKSIAALFFIPFFLISGERPTYDFLRQDVSARASAMAGSFVSMNGDPTGVFYNPASIGTALSPQAVFGYTNHLLDINAGFAVYSQELPDIGVFGLGVNYINYGTFDETDVLANKLGTFGAGDMALSLSLARLYDENIYYGVTAKLIYSSIADVSSSAIAADIGLLYLIPGDDPMSFGISLSNIGTQLDPYMETKESLPFELKIGGTIKPQHLPLQLNLNFHKLNEERDSFAERFNAFSLGGEFTLSKALRFRFGYNNERRKELKIGTSAGMAGFSLGGGLVLNKLRLDYSFNSLGKIGSMSRITVALDV